MKTCRTAGVAFINNSNSATRTDIPNWLGVRLEGVQANRSAIGARIKLYYPGGIQVREVASGRGTASGDSLVQYFGLGQYGSADRLEISWPAGCALQVVPVGAINRIVSIVEDCTVAQPIRMCKGTDITLPLPNCFDWDPLTGPYRDPSVAVNPSECMFYNSADPGRFSFRAEGTDVLVNR